MQIITYLCFVFLDGVSIYEISAIIPLVVERIILEIVHRIKMRKHYYLLQDEDNNYYYCKPWKIYKVKKKYKLIRAFIPKEYKPYSKDGAYPLKIVKALEATKIS